MAKVLSLAVLLASFVAACAGPAEWKAVADEMERFHEVELMSASGNLIKRFCRFRLLC